ncbi:MAG: hypothetical protein RBR32_01725 [Bacteroidales bacterium]|nr:hypothetical protein [Bacteroidales bacterium]
MVYDYIENTRGMIFDRKVIFSTDNNLFYSFFSPIASYVWSKFNYHPIVFIVGDSGWYSNKVNSFILKKTLEAGADVVFLNSDRIHSNPAFDGYNLGVVAQVSRFCSPCIISDDKTYCLTSDVDMIPMKRDWFFQQDMEKPIHLFYANGYNHKRYPVCYIGMNISTWRKVMGIWDKENIYLAINRLLKFGLRRNSRKEVQWGYDEVLFYNKIIRYSNYSDCQMIDREIFNNPAFYPKCKGIPEYLPIDRLDRSYWDDRDLSKYVEAHCMRPGYEINNWNYIYKVLEYVLNPMELIWINDYYDSFMGKLR